MRLREWHKRLKSEESKTGEEQAATTPVAPAGGVGEMPSPASAEAIPTDRPGTRVRGPARLPEVRPPSLPEVPKKHLPSVGAPARPAPPAATEQAGSDAEAARVENTAPPVPQPGVRPIAPSRSGAAARFERGRALAIEQALARIRGTQPAAVPETVYAEDAAEPGKRPAPTGDIERRAARMGKRAREILSAWRTRQGALPLDIEEPRPKRGRPRTVTESRETLIERLLDPELTLHETATLLNVCPSTVRRYTDKGILGHHRTPGNQRRFRLSDVLEFMERQQHGTR